MVGVKHNGIIVSVQRWETHKKPVLAVQFEGKNCIYKVASFNSEETADWFAAIMGAFFDGMVKKGEAE